MDTKELASTNVNPLLDSESNGPESEFWECDLPSMLGERTCDACRTWIRASWTQESGEKAE